MANKKVLLVVDDDAILRNVLCEALDGEGFKTLTATSGKEGLKVALDEQPDLILLDILMPEMSGVKVMEALRNKNEWGKKVPIILLTNVSPDDEKINTALATHEPAYYLVKSKNTMSEVVGKVKERLSPIVPESNP